MSTLNGRTTGCVDCRLLLRDLKTANAERDRYREEKALAVSRMCDARQEAAEFSARASAYREGLWCIHEILGRDIPDERKLTILRRGLNRALKGKEPSA